MQKALPMKQISITWRNVSVYSNALALLPKMKTYSHKNIKF